MDIFDRLMAAVAKACYGSPSLWGAENPRGWVRQDGSPLPGRCSPHDAAMHDNGVTDAMRLIREFQRSETPPSGFRAGAEWAAGIAERLYHRSGPAIRSALAALPEGGDGPKRWRHVRRRRPRQLTIRSPSEPR